KVAGRETYSASGVVRTLDGSGKELAVRDLDVRPATSPELEPETKDLVLLDLPVRSREHILSSINANEQLVHTLRSEDLIPLLAADAATRSGPQAASEVALWTQRSDFRSGLWALLLASGADPSATPIPAQVARTPVGRYLRWVQPAERREWSKLLDLGDGMLR